MDLDLADQYRTSAKLDARRALHLKYGRDLGMAGLADALDIAPGARVLEVGCGPGRFWPPLAERLPAELSLTLTDLSPGMVAEALATVRGAGRWADVTAEVADVSSLPYPDASFDVVLALYMLYHPPDPDRAVAEIARVLKPGGRLIAATNGQGNLASLFALRQCAFPGAGRALMSDPFTLESGRPILERHFAEVTVTRACDALAVTDPADIVAYIASSPPADTASEAELARLAAVAADAFAAGGGVFTVARDTGYMTATRPRRSAARG